MPTIPAVLRAAAAAVPDRDSLVTEDVRLSYAQLLAAVRRASAAWIAHGIEPGDRVAIWGPNSAHWAVRALSLTGVGAVVVPINSRFKGEEARYLLDRSGARALAVDDTFLASLLGADPLEALGDPDLLVVRTSEVEAFLERADEVPEGLVEERAAAVAENDASDIVFTSGTTGRPKGVVATHGQSTRLFQTWADTVGLREADRMLVVAPFFHTFGYKAGLLACLLQRATCVPLQVFDVDQALSTIHAERIDVVPGPPTLYSSLLEHPSLRQAPLQLRLAVTGAAVVPEELVRRMRTELGFAEVITAYGLTECTGFATACRPGDADEVVARTSGRAVDGVEVRVDAPTGEPGEVLVRGYNVMQGYWQDPEATAEAVDSDGWLHTGDIGVMDTDGNLRITDRLKDMYVVGGFNAYPAEIEQVLVQHPGVSEAAVIGVPDDRMGEIGKAFVVPRTGASVAPAELLAWCKQRLANYKVPRTVELVDALPKNASGKVTKAALRA